MFDDSQVGFTGKLSTLLFVTCIKINVCCRKEKKEQRNTQFDVCTVYVLYHTVFFFFFVESQAQHRPYRPALAYWLDEFFIHCIILERNNLRVTTLQFIEVSKKVLKKTFNYKNVNREQSVKLGAIYNNVRAKGLLYTHIH